MFCDSRWSASGTHSCMGCCDVFRQASTSEKARARSTTVEQRFFEQWRPRYKLQGSHFFAYYVLVTVPQSDFAASQKFLGKVSEKRVQVPGRPEYSDEAFRDKISRCFLSWEGSIDPLFSFRLQSCFLDPDALFQHGRDAVGSWQIPDMVSSSPRVTLAGPSAVHSSASEGARRVFRTNATTWCAPTNTHCYRM